MWTRVCRGSMSRPSSSKLAVDDVQRHTVGGDAELFRPPAAELESAATKRKIVQGWPILWANFRALIGISSQSVRPSLAIWANPVQFSLCGALHWGKLESTATVAHPAGRRCAWWLCPGLMAITTTLTLLHPSMPRNPETITLTFYGPGCPKSRSPSRKPLGPKPRVG